MGLTVDLRGTDAERPVWKGWKWYMPALPCHSCGAGEGQRGWGAILPKPSCRQMQTQRPMAHPKNGFRRRNQDFQEPPSMRSALARKCSGHCSNRPIAVSSSRLAEMNMSCRPCQFGTRAADPVGQPSHPPRRSVSMHAKGGQDCTIHVGDVLLS